MAPIKNPNIQAVDWIQYQLRQLSWQAILGILLISLTIVYFFLVILPTENALLEQQLAAVDAQKKMQQDSLNDKAPVTTKENQLYLLLPTKDKANEQISIVLNLAAQSGLQVDKVAYTQSLENHVLQLQMNLPIEGKYVQIRQFIHDVLKEIPTLALSELSLRRDDMMTDKLNAQIDLILYFKDEMK